MKLSKFKKDQVSVSSLKSIKGANADVMTPFFLHRNLQEVWVAYLRNSDKNQDILSMLLYIYT